MSSTILSRYRALSAELHPERELRDLARIRALRASATIAGEWLGVAAGIALFATLEQPLFYPLLVAWIGSRMLGLWVLAHDGLHHTLLPDRRWNDAVTRVLLAWPIFISLSEFRRVHLEHHRSLRTPEDPESALSAYPEFRFPKTRVALLRVLLLDLSGVHFVRFFLKRQRARLQAPGSDAPGRRRPGAAKVTYGVAVALALTGLGAWPEFLLYWLVPYATWFQMALRMRLMAEHLNLPESEPLQTRSIRANLLERCFFVPHSVHYHVEHHLHPGVPSYNLPRAAERLRRHEAFRACSPLREGYLRVFREFERAV